MSQYTTPAYHPSSVLHDVSATGRERPWAKHKAEAQVIAAALRVAGRDDLADRITPCADWLSFRRLYTGQLHLHRASFCRLRICPICQWRRSLRTAAIVRDADAWLAADRAARGLKPYRHAMLTLTVPNVKGSDLPATITAMLQGWQRLMQRKQVRAAVRGSIRSLEIRYSADRGDYHPHIHALLCVPASYYTGRTYIPHATWLQLWRDAMRDDRITQVDIRRATDLPGLVAEVAKYSVKPADLVGLASDLDRLADVALTMLQAGQHRRYLAFGGEYRRAYQAIGAPDPDDDLLHIDPDADLTDAERQTWVYTWCPGPRLYML